MAKEEKGIMPNERARRGQLIGRGHRMMRPFEEVDRLFNDYWPRSLLRGAFDAPVMQEMVGFDARLPRVNLMDQENAIVLHAELPGVDKKDVEISVSDDTVTIRASTQEEKEEQETNYYHHEIAQGSFIRSMSLPVAVDADKAEAKFQDGVLKLTLPKMQQSKRRQIQIQ